MSKRSSGKSCSGKQGEAAKDLLLLTILRQAFDDLVRPGSDGSLIPLLKRMRDNPNGKLAGEEVIPVFTGLGDWDRQKKPGGHAEFKSKLLGHTVGFSSHRKDGTLASHEKASLIGIIQDYISILANHIFRFKYHSRQAHVPGERHNVAKKRTERRTEMVFRESCLNNYKLWCVNGRPRGDEQLHDANVATPVL